MSVDPQRNKTVLTVLAHPDDAEILCGGVLLKLADRGFDIHIATMTPGDCGSAELGPERIAEIRRREGAAAAEKVGGTYHCLESRDLFVCFDETHIRRTIDLMRKVNPAIVITHPRHDYMLDHEQTHLIARHATFAFPIPNASKLPPPENAAIPYLYYCDPIEGLDPYTGEPVSPDCLLDVGEVIDRKADMLARHASQREWLRSHHGMDEYLEAMKRHAARRGEEAGVEYAEAFQRHKGHPYPSDDALTRLLAS